MFRTEATTAVEPAGGIAPDTPALVERSVPGLHDALISRLPSFLTKDSTVLDVGCGSGAWLLRLHQHGFQNLDGTADVQQFGFAGASIYRNDLNTERWALGREQYDLITAIELVEHLDNVGTFLANIRALLSERGVLLLTTPNVQSLPTRLRFFLTGDMKQFGALGDQTHVFPVLQATIERLVAKHGLWIESRWGYPEGGKTVTSRSWVNLLSAGLRLLVPEPLPGDVACFLIRKL